MPDLRYTLEQEKGGIHIHAIGKTRAGLFTAASHALFEAMKPGKFVETAEQNQRDFHLQEATSEALLSKLMNEGLRVAKDYKEACQELRLNLITDTKLEGSFVGCEVTHFDHPVESSSASAISVAKDDMTGEWHADIKVSR
jgi:SHS2 domain-containing protein